MKSTIPEHLRRKMTTVRIKPDLHRLLKTAAYLRGMLLQDAFEEGARMFIKEYGQGLPPELYGPDLNTARYRKEIRVKFNPEHQP